jgi:hypothetical protein
MLFNRTDEKENNKTKRAQKVSVLEVETGFNISSFHAIFIRSITIVLEIYIQYKTLV